MSGTFPDSSDPIRSLGRHRSGVLVTGSREWPAASFVHAPLALSLWRSDWTGPGPETDMVGVMLRRRIVSLLPVRLTALSGVAGLRMRQRPAPGGVLSLLPHLAGGTVGAESFADRAAEALLLNAKTSAVEARRGVR
mmetsp:Transcript_12977/g.36994  ORF Transcript_12977/g.36994 Transcript_12977/m.36994 type:complete len:137 (+) Transcript_12977:502-912(+)